MFTFLAHLSTILLSKVTNFIFFHQNPAVLPPSVLKINLPHSKSCDPSQLIIEDPAHFDLHSLPLVACSSSLEQGALSRLKIRKHHQNEP